MQSTQTTDIAKNSSRTNKVKVATKREVQAIIERVKRGDYPVEQLRSLATFAAITAGAAAIGASATRKNRGLWYFLQRKPPFQPPKWAFGPAWTALYTLIAASGWRVYRAPKSAERTQALGLWGTQLALNTGWSLLFFGKKAKKLALADLVALLAAIAAYTERASKVDRAAAWMMAPYLGWVSFAGVLNEEIARRNH